MDELSRADFFRLSYAEKKEHLKRLLGEKYDQSDVPSDSEDEDWFPKGNAPNSTSAEASDNEDCIDDEVEIDGGTQEDDDDERDAEEKSDNEVASDVSASTSTTFVAKDKTVWNKTSPQKQQFPARNIVRQRAGSHKSMELLSISGTFKKFMRLEMVNIIVRCTNKKTEAEYQDHNSKHSQNESRVWKKVTVTEMYSFLGILIGAGANNSNTDHIDEMWGKNLYPLYRGTMGRRRFQSLLCFDDYATCQERAANDKAAPISDINFSLGNYCNRPIL